MGNERRRGWARLLPGGGGLATAIAGVAALVAVVAPSVVQAEVIVIGSSAAALKPGMVLDDARKIELPAGARVRVMTPSGRTQEIKGPASVQVASLGKGEARNESLWNDVKRLVAAQKTASESSVGAVRSVAPKTSSGGVRGSAPGGAGAAPAFSWRRVSIDYDGDVCIEKGASLELLRGAPGRPLTVVVVDLQERKRVPAEFGVGAATTAWPQGMASGVGRYSVVLPDGAKREIRLRPIDPLPQADDTIRLLHSQRCLGQVEAWLRGQLTASR